MKRKSLYEKAIEQKENEIKSENRIYIIKNKLRLLVFIEIIGEIFKIILYIILLVLSTIGSTVLLNNETRILFIDAVKKYVEIF